MDDVAATAATTVRRPRLLSEASRWTPFTTAQERLRKIGPGSIITPEAVAARYQYVATAECVLLRLRPAAMDRVEAQAPFTAVAVLKLVNAQAATRVWHANKRVSQLSSLLYK